VEKLSHDDDEAISRELKKYLLLNAFLAHIAPHGHCTHKVANVSQRSSIASLLLYCLCRIVATVVVVVLLLPCTCSCMGPNQLLFSGSRRQIRKAKDRWKRPKENQKL
jgi:hypothetical protein